MKNFKRISAALLILLMLICLSSVSVFATSTTQDGLEATLKTDKDSYSKSDRISASLTVKNANSTDIENVVLEALVPDDYTITDNLSKKKNIGTLKSGETVKLDVIYSPKSSDDEKNNKLTENSGNKIDNKVNNNTNSTNNTSGQTSSGNTVKTGDIIGVIIVSALVLTVCGILIGFMLKNKKSQKFLSLLLAISVLGGIAVIYTPFDTFAAESSDKTTKKIFLSHKIKIDNTDFSIQANIAYSNISETSVNIAEEYYQNNTKVLSVIKATDSQNVQTEQEVSNLLSKRGFDTTALMTNCTIDGKNIADTNVDINSKEKHPLYKMIYASEAELLWTIYVVDGVISAYPVSYNMVSERQAALLITETDSITSYDYSSNQFYKTIPKESTVIVRKVEQINKKTLDAMTIGDLATL